MITKIAGKTLDLNSLVSKEEYINTTYMDMGDKLVDSANTQIKDVYIERTKNDIKIRLEDKGYVVGSIDIQVELEDDSRYGEINSINIKISGKEGQNVEPGNDQVNSISKIEKINISLSGTDNTTANTDENIIDISEEDINEIKNLLETIYGVNQQNIYINM